ncbi:MAG: DUF6090 family protein [Cyclonatronaceae bacterium]
MLKFFRKIRQNLLLEGKTGKYLKYAIGEILLVVVGILIALQVNNWNEVRKERIQEHILLTRLHAETRTLVALTSDEYRDYRARGEALLSVNIVLFSQEPARPLTVRECEGIAGSHVYRLGSDNLPVLDEMLVTGRFDLLRNITVKEQLRDYLLFRGRDRSIHEERTSELFRLHSRWPELISVTRAPMEEGYEGRWTFLSGDDFRWSLHCDVEKMRETAGFLNEYVDNLARTENTIRAHEQREQLVRSLERTLAAELGVPPLAEGTD